MIQLTRPKVIAITLLAVLAALGSASGVFAPVIESASLQLTPAFGCPGTPVALVATYPSLDGFKVQITSYPDGLITNFIGGPSQGGYRGTFTVGDSVCAGDYVVTITITALDASGSQTLSTHFTVGGNGCPNLPVCRPVGGVVMPTNTLAITAPYLALAGLIAAVSAVVAVKRRRD